MTSQKYFFFPASWCSRADDNQRHNGNSFSELLFALLSFCSAYASPSFIHSFPPSSLSFLLSRTIYPLRLSMDGPRVRGVVKNMRGKKKTDTTLYEGQEERRGGEEKAKKNRQVTWGCGKKTSKTPQVRFARAGVGLSSSRLEHK